MVSIGCFGLEFLGVELRNLSREKVIYLFTFHSSLNSFFLGRVPTVTIVVFSGEKVSFFAPGSSEDSGSYISNLQGSQQSNL